jgi:tetratricopeptide (TPR) repeat protein
MERCRPVLPIFRRTDHLLGVGDDWHAHIQSTLTELPAVLLVSPPFLASKYVRNSQLPVLLRNAKQNNLGLVLQEKGDLSGAMYFYLRYLESDPKDAFVCLNLGVVFHNLGNYDKAVQYYGRAEKEEPDDPLIRKNHALALLALGRVEEASATLLRAREVAPQDAEVDRILGSAFDSGGETVRVLEFYESAIRKDPNDHEAHLQSAILLSRRGQYQEAVKRAEAVAHLFREANNHEGAAEACWEIGWDYYMLGDWTKSLQASTEALKLNPDLAPVRFNRGLTLLQLGRPEEARKQYEEGIARLAQTADLKSYAIDDLRDALDKSPNLVGGAKILAMLEDKYASLSRDLTKPADQVTA